MILLKIDHFFVLGIYQFIVYVNHFENLYITEWNYVAKDLNNHKKISFYPFSKINIYTASKCKVILSTIYLHLLRIRLFQENAIYQIKVCFNDDSIFKLFEIVVLANFIINTHKNQKRSCYIFILFSFLKEKTMIQFLLWPTVYHILQY